MSIQILGLRRFGNSPKAVEAFFERGWRAPSVQDLLRQTENYLEKIPEAERYNLYFTVGDCLEQPGRKVQRQDVLPFDIDGIDREKADEVFKVACEALGLDVLKTGGVFSGNGIQFFVQGKDVIEPSVDPEVYDKMRPAYKAACVRLNMWLKENGLEGKADPSVWSPARIMRLPMTINRKPGKGEVMARHLNRIIEPQDWDLRTATGIVEMAPRDVVDVSMLRRAHGKMDLDLIAEECSFIGRGASEPALLSEPEWFAWLGVVAFADPADHIWIHEKSKGHPGYSEAETRAKIEQVLDNQTGPRSCFSISAKAGHAGCKTCPHFGAITTPAQIRGPDHIITENTGFHTIHIKEGKPIVGKPSVDDLCRFWMRSNEHVSIHSNIFTFKKTHWVVMDKYKVKAFAQEHFKPTPQSFYFEEFTKQLGRLKVVGDDFFNTREPGLINFANGVLNIKTGELYEHSAEYKFKYVLPYDWNPKAVAPQWDKFMQEITCGDEGIQQLLNEYLGYALGGETPYLQVCLFLFGGGANGKSTYLSVIKQVLGGENCTTLGPGDIHDENKMRLLDGKLASITEETDSYSMRKTSTIKNAITGGEVWAKSMYQDKYPFINNAKFYLAGNEKPLSNDKEEGLYRRIIFVPFNAVFPASARDPHLAKKLSSQDVLSYIARKAIESIPVLAERGHLAIPEACALEMEEYKYANDSELVFVKERIQFTNDSTHVITNEQLYRVYEDWCVETGVRVKARQVFLQSMASKHFKGKAEQYKNGNQRGWKFIKARGPKVWPLP